MPVRANFVEKSTHRPDRQMCAFFWQGQKDLNPRPMVLETSTLPTELYPYEQRYYTKLLRLCQYVLEKDFKQIFLCQKLFKMRPRLCHGEIITLLG